MGRESRRTVAPATQAAAPRTATRTAQTGWVDTRRVREWHHIIVRRSLVMDFGAWYSLINYW